ncbi:MAG: DMT family transporter [Candidatus Wallbacteria bacterium]|nr:DMT family transporter [Candidatus Wallbacteria bacterium]
MIDSPASLLNESGDRFEKRPPSWVLVVVAVALNLIWALSYPVSKGLISSIDPLALSCLRIGGGSLMLLPFLSRRDFPAHTSIKDWSLLAFMGLIGCGTAIVLQYTGTGHSTASNASMITGLETSIVVLLSACFLSEPLNRRSIASVAIAFLGVVLLTVDPDSLDLLSSKHLIGNLLLCISIVCYSAYTIAGKKLITSWGANAITVLPFALAALILIPVYAWYDPAGFQKGLHLSGSEWLGVLFLAGPGTALAYLGWNWLLHFMSAGELSLYLYIQPLAGAIFSVWLLGERITWTFFAGAVLILGAMVFGNRTVPTH